MFSYKDSFENIDVINLITTHVATEGYCRITSILDLTEVQQYLDSINQIDALTIWQDFGFKLNKKQASKPAGYQNKLFISQLRRGVEKLSI